MLFLELDKVQFHSLVPVVQRRSADLDTSHPLDHFADITPASTLIVAHLEDLFVLRSGILVGRWDTAKQASSAGCAGFGLFAG